MAVRPLWWSSTTGIEPSPTGNGNGQTRREVLIGDLYQAVLDDYALNGQRSVRNVKGSWDNHLKAAFGSVPVVPFRPSRVKKYITGRKAAGAAKATVNRELAVIKRMSTLAIAEYEAENADTELIANLMRWAKIKGLDESDNVREQVFPNELYDAFVSSTSREGLWFRTMFEIAYTHGWRPGSLKQLQVKNVDLARRTLRLTAKQTKNKRPCEIGMTDVEYELLRQCVAGKGPEDYVLTREKDASNRKPKNDGRIVDYRLAWKRACKRVGVEPGRAGLIFYDLKRAGATNLIDSGMDEKEAMLNTGQKTPSVFRRYHQVSAEKLQESARKIERARHERQRKLRYRQAEMFPVDTARKPS